MSSFIRIRKDIISKPLLETREASVIEFFDADGKMTALLIRQFTDGMWGLVTKVDPDWEATLIRMGYISVKATPEQFVSSIST